MGGIADLLDSDMEDSTNFIDENSILSSASESGAHDPTTNKGGRSKNNKNRVTKPKAAPRKPKTSPKPAAKNPSKKTTSAKRKALEEHVNGQTSQPDHRGSATADKMEDVSEDELESPKTLGVQKPEVATKPKGNKTKRTAAKKEVVEEVEVDQTPTVARSSNLQSGLRKDVPKVITKPTAFGRPKQTTRPVIPESQPEPMVTEAEGQDRSELAPLAPKSRVRAGSSHRQESTFRRRAGSASDTERGGDPNLRRKLGDVTRKFENIDLKYRNLKDVGISEANANMEKLRKQCEATTAASNELIASLKKELAMQLPVAQESRKLQKTLASKESETNLLRASISDLSSSLTATQNEVKTLQARLAASRGASVEVANSKTPKNNNGATRTIMVGSAEAAQAAQVAQLKEDLYSDLTGLIVRGVKRTEEGDTYDCIQTGRNGSKYSSSRCYLQL